LSQEAGFVRSVAISAHAIAGFISGSFQGVYNGSKAFINSFADAIRNELKDATGITITTWKQAQPNRRPVLVWRIMGLFGT